MVRRPTLTSRRSFASGLGVALTGALAGCTSNKSGGGGGGEETTTEQTTTTTTTEQTTKTSADAVVAVGPNGSLRFEPERVGISKGDTVLFEFESGGHNVGGNPKHHDTVSIPDGAQPFASYSNGNKYSTDAAGTTYSHTFETAGKYTYVCIPHASAGMVGHITVR